MPIKDKFRQKRRHSPKKETFWDGCNCDPPTRCRQCFPTWSPPEVPSGRCPSHPRPYRGPGRPWNLFFARSNGVHYAWSDPNLLWSPRNGNQVRFRPESIGRNIEYLEKWILFMPILRSCISCFRKSGYFVPMSIFSSCISFFGIRFVPANFPALQKLPSSISSVDKIWVSFADISTGTLSGLVLTQ